MNTPRSVLLCAAPVFAHVIEHKWARDELNSAQRDMAIRVAPAYRTVSAASLNVITRTMPTVLETKKRKITHMIKCASGDNDMTDFLDKNVNSGGQWNSAAPLASGG